MQNIWPNATKTVCTKYKVGKLGSVALLIIIWQTYDQAFSSSALRTMKTSNIVFLVFMSTALFAFFLVIAFFSSKIFFNRADTTAICYCVPAKTPASKSHESQIRGSTLTITVGVPMSTVLFVGMAPLLEAKIQLPLVIYQGLQIMAGTVLTGPFKKWVDAEKAS